MVVARANVDGRIGAPEDAVVPVLDRGFLYGDSIYEVVWWHRGAPIQWTDHIERLHRSANHMAFTVALGEADLLDAVLRTVEAAHATLDDDLNVRLVVTRGVGPLGLWPSGPHKQSTIVLVHPVVRPAPTSTPAGVRAQIVARRRMAPDAFDPAAKTGNYMNSALALIEAKRAGHDEAILLNAAGFATEASTANIYIVRDGRLETPALEAGLLEGTSRKRILALAKAKGLTARETWLRTEDLASADELFASSSVRGIVPIVALDGSPVGSGSPGPSTLALRAAFEAAADDEARAWRAAHKSPIGSA